MIPNMLVSISGLPKSGKTWLSMTFPEPIKVFSFDSGADFVRTRFPKKEIVVRNFILPVIETEVMSWASEPWDEFYSEFMQSVVDGEYQTVVIDTATAAEIMLRQAILEWLQEEADIKNKVKRKLATNEYVARNLRMKAIFDRARVSGINLVTIQYLGERWVRKAGADRAESTGELVLQGWNQTEGYADLNIEMTAKDKGDKTVMIATIKSNRFDRDVNRKSFEDTNFEEIAALLFGE
uniref:Putative ATPase domain containing protein n=1 Tax=viral metagenome TaxID=1070528 RepID=A0A6M3KXT6_9ZZZZ